MVFVFSCFDAKPIFELLKLAFVNVVRTFMDAHADEDAALPLSNERGLIFSFKAAKTVLFSFIPGAGEDGAIWLELFAWTMLQVVDPLTLESGAIGLLEFAVARRFVVNPVALVDLAG